jgi:exodeoxyribonuclease V alpha subunit
MDEVIETKGTVETIIFQADDSDYVIFRLNREEENETITVTGHGPVPLTGDRISVQGRWIQHRKYGRQFGAIAWQRIDPDTIEGIERFLSSGYVRGIGPALAHRIVEAFGTDTMDVLSHNPNQLLTIEGIGEKKLALISESFYQEKQLHDLALELETHGASGRYAARLLQVYGDDASYVLHQEPYRMIREVEGIGFKTADQLALSFGMEPQSGERLEAGLEYVLFDMTQNGHVCLPREELLRRAVSLLHVDGLLLDDTLTELIRLEQIMTAEYGGTTYLYTANAYKAEQCTAERLLEMVELPPLKVKTHIQLFLDRWQQSCQFSLADGQRQAVEQSVETGILVITGGPGTGKTTIVKTIIGLAEEESLRILLCAPTGRAAKRLAETTERQAMTIHRMLGLNGFYDGMQQFDYNESNPLKADLVIVDEVSMLDLEMMYHLLQALPPSCRVILVGDADQLPSVGAGAVLHDIISSGKIPVVRLETIFRQKNGGGIVTNAHRINRGAMPVLDGEDEFRFVAISDEASGADQISRIYKDEVALAGDEFSVQVLSPMYRLECGVDNLNRLIQAQANAAAAGVSEYAKGTVLFRVGDKVLQKKNDYEKGVFNGDIGKIWAIQKDVIYVRYPEQDVRYEGKDIDEITLAYAITVHKSQGSEYHTVIMVLVNSHYIMLQRNLLYTAVTRAKRRVILVGTEKALQAAVSNVRTSRRFTLLAQRLRQEDLW